MKKEEIYGIMLAGMMILFLTGDEEVFNEAGKQYWRYRVMHYHLTNLIFSLCGIFIIFIVLTFDYYILNLVLAFIFAFVGGLMILRS